MVREEMGRIRAQEDAKAVAERARSEERFEKQEIKLDAIMEEVRSIRELIRETNRESTDTVIERLAAIQKLMEEVGALAVVAGELVVGLGTAVEEVGVVVNRIRQQQRALPSPIIPFYFSCIFCSDELPQLYHPQSCDDACRRRLFLL